MKSTSDKQGMSFYLPSLSSSSPFYQELVYHQNKFIVYAQQQKNNKRSSSNLSSSKTSFFPSRPNTTATFNNRFSPKNQLSRNRNQESIDRFIQRNQKINSIRYQSNNHLKKIKANNSNYNKTLKNHQSLTQQFFTKDKLDFSDFTKIQDIKFQRNNQKSINEHQSTSQLVSQLNKPQEKLINEIKMYKNKSPQENTKMMKSIKSLGKLHTQRSIIEDKVINDMQFSVDRERPPIEIKARNHFPLRKTISMTPAQTSRFLKNSKLFNHTSPRKFKQEIKESAKKQPEIKQQNLTNDNKNSNQEEGKTQKEEENNLKYGQNNNEIENILDPKFIYNMTIKFNPRWQDSLEDTQVKIKPSKKVSNQKSKDQQNHSLEDKLNTQRGISSKQLQNKNIDKFQKDFLEDFIESIVKENIREMQEKFINEEIQKLSQSKPEILQNSGLIQTQNESHFTCSQVNPSQMNMKSTSPSKFLKQKNKKSQKKMIKKSNKRQQLDLNNLKRAKIVDFLDDKYYKSRKGHYWKMVTQQKNVNLQKIQNQKHEQSQTFQYPTEQNQSKIQQSLIENSMHPTISLPKYNIYIDNEFPHQGIQIPQLNQKTNWLYFEPCKKSSLFPKEVKIPQNYVQKSTKKQLPLVDLLNCLLTINPKIIERLIQPSYNNVFSVWLNVKGIFEPIFVDGYLPYDSRLNSLYGHTEQFLWVAVLIKAAAKVFGGYHALQRLSVYNWSKLILGYQLEILPKPEYEQIRNWSEQQFDQKIQEYLRKAETKHQSYITIHNKETNKFSAIKSIKSNKMKILDCNIEMKTHEISLFELLIDTNYELVLVPQSQNCYHCNGQFEIFNEGNIASYRIKVTEDKSWIKIAINNLCQYQQKQKQQATNVDTLKRRVVIYEIPISFKKQNKKEMILKHAIDNKSHLRSFNHNKANNLLLECHIAQLKKGYYKVFIQCGNVKVNDYMIDSNQIGFNNWGISYESKMVNDNIGNNYSRQIGTNNFMERKEQKSIISFTSNNKIQIQTTQNIFYNSKILYQQ